MSETFGAILIFFLIIAILYVVYLIIRFIIFFINKIMGWTFRDFILFTFKPTKFIQQNNWLDIGWGEYKKSMMFMFISLLFLGLSPMVINAIVYAHITEADVYYSSIPESFNLWQISGDKLLFFASIIGFSIPALGWLYARICSNKNNIPSKICVIFPYALWHTIVVFLFFSIILLFGLCTLVFLISLFYHAIVFWVANNYLALLGSLVLISILLVFNKIGVFIKNLEIIYNPSSMVDFPYFLFPVGCITILFLTLWWSMLNLAKPVTTIVVVPETNIVFTDSLHYVVNIAFKNITNQPLFTSNKGSVVDYYDDENPIYDAGERTPNGNFKLTTSEGRKLPDKLSAQMYNGSLDSLLFLDMRGMYKDDQTSGEEGGYSSGDYEEARIKAKSIFKNIINHKRKGSFDVKIVVSTKEGKLSNRTFTLL